MDKATKREIMIRMLWSPLLFAAVVFLPAGTLNYWQAWLSLVVFMVPATLLTVWLVNNDPALLERRMKVGPTEEPRLAQRIIVTLLLASFALSYVISALDFRFAWSSVPPLAVLLGDALLVVSWWIFYLVMRTNSYAASTVRVESEQKVISTGPYAIVRHPMYSGALLLMVGIPLSLASYWGIAVTVLALPVLYFRITDEEKLLVNDLPGYAEYRNRVRFRLIPGVY